MVTRKLVVLMVAVIFIIGIAATASFAGSCGTCAKPTCAPCPKPCAPCDPCAGDPVKKLGRGLANMLTFVMEIPNQISKTNQCDGPMAAATVGVVKGVGMAAFRAVVGVYEVLTFPIAIPECYKPILTDPEYMLENCSC